MLALAAEPHLLRAGARLAGSQAEVVRALRSDSGAGGASVSLRLSYSLGHRKTSALGARLHLRA